MAKLGFTHAWLRSRTLGADDPDVAIRQLRASAFQALFNLRGPLGDEAQLVLASLRDYCRAQVTTTGASREETYLNNGRRDVWLFLMQQLNFDENTITQLKEPTDEYLGY